MGLEWVDSPAQIQRPAGRDEPVPLAPERAGTLPPPHAFRKIVGKSQGWPFGKAARATRMVSSGTGPGGAERNDIGDLLSRMGGRHTMSGQPLRRYQIAAPLAAG